MFTAMSSNFSIGKYFPAESNIHRMNPLSKTLCTVIFIIIILFNWNLEVTGILTLLVMIMILNTNLPLIVYYQVVKTLRYPLIFVLLLGMLITFSITGGFIALINVVLIILYTAILTLTTSPTEIIYGFEKILSPLNKFGIKTNKIALNISLGLRFIPTITDQSNKILKAEASRGVDSSTSSQTWFIAMKRMVNPAFRLSVRKLKKLKTSMELRLFTIDKQRTNFRINKWHLFDSYLLVIHIAILIVIILRGVIM